MSSTESRLSGDWVSIWDLAVEYWRQKPRFFASRLLNYSILNDLPRKVGDVMGAIGGDAERLYNISVNSPNVDRISKEVFLSLSLIRSHLESGRFNPEDRYLPRRPRQEEYLITKPADPVQYMPVGDGATPIPAEDRLNYFARMGIPYGITRKKKQPVALDYRQNLLLDRDSPQIKRMAENQFGVDTVVLPEGVAPPSRLGSINSEQVLLWNVFRTLIREEGMHYFLDAPTIWPADDNVALDERISAAWFWGMNDRGSNFLPLESALKSMNEPEGEVTTPDLILLGINRFIIVETRFASTVPSCHFLRRGQCPGSEGCTYWNKESGISRHLLRFVERQDLQRTCGRHYHLMRLFLLMKAISEVQSMGDGRLLIVIDDAQQAGQSNRKLLDRKSVV